MMDQFHQKLVEKEEALAKLQEDLQERKEVNQPSISTPKSSTMTETNMVRSPSI